MDYVQLTGKYRPKKFIDVVGQKVAVGTLESMIYNNKINPTIMLSGEYGVGKTTLARIVARYVNCDTRNACGVCKSCIALDNGTHPDIIEINAANTRGIDDIRELINSASFTPRSNYRVFILDEIHQLTTTSSQALLKPLEEPPKKTLWLLCTTDPQKILASIRSRCQHIKLQKVPTKNIQGLLSMVCEEEKLPFPSKVIDLVANLADGHPRNALMLLEQVQHYVISKGVIPDNLEEILPTVFEELGSLPPEILVSKYVQYLLDASHRLCCKSVKQVENPEYFLHIVYKFLRDILYELTGVTSDPKVSSFLMQSFKRNYTKEHIIKLLDLHLTGLSQAKQYSLDPYDVLDLVVIKSLELMATAPLKVV
jgi:DNA polymerase-3 subunit gamma/tau